MTNQFDTIITGLDSDSQLEFFNVFIVEFKELLDEYKITLDDLNLEKDQKSNIFYKFFRIYHTLKGDSAYFPGFKELTKFTEEMCEQLRNLPPKRYDDGILIQTLKINYTVLSDVWRTLCQGSSILEYSFTEAISSY